MRSFLLLPLLVFASISVAKPIEKRNAVSAAVDGTLHKSKGPDIKIEGASPSMVLKIAYTNPHGIKDHKSDDDWENFWSGKITSLSKNTWTIAPNSVKVKEHGAPKGYTHLATITLPSTVTLDPTDKVTKTALVQIVGNALGYENNDPRLYMKVNGDPVLVTAGEDVVMPGAGVNPASAKSTEGNTPSDAPLTGTNANPNANTNTDPENTKTDTDTGNKPSTEDPNTNSDP